MRYGLFVREYIGNRPLPVNEEAEEIEDLICILACQNIQTYKYANAIRAYYLFNNKNKRSRS